MPGGFAEKLFHATVRNTDDGGELEPSAQGAEPRSYLQHVIALSFSKIADGLLSPKLVLSWLLTQLGAGSFWVGLLVPVRESLALLPQLFTAPQIAAHPVRKRFWAFGAIVQGLSAGAIAVAGLILEGAAAGAVIVTLLAILALARSVCSASYKDVLGKTIGTSRRGTVTGLASSAAASMVIVFALALMLGLADRTVLVIAALLCASALWVIAGAVFFTLAEPASHTGEHSGMAAQIKHLADDAQLVRFIAVRSLLVGTALAPPYLVALTSSSAFEALGAFVLAAALASLVSSYVWGRLSDRSSRRVLLYSGLAGGAVLGCVLLSDQIGATATFGVTPALLFALMLSYEGVRQGRSTHLVDMAPEDRRASYTALSNTGVGLVLIGAGGLAAVLSSYSVGLVIGVFSVMCFAGAGMALGLSEVQGNE